MEVHKRIVAVASGEVWQRRTELGARYENHQIREVVAAGEPWQRRVTAAGEPWQRIKTTGF